MTTTMVGFRAEDNPQGKGNRVLSKASVYGVKGATTEKYSPLGLSPATHLLVGFDLVTMHSSPTQREKPEFQPCSVVTSAPETCLGTDGPRSSSVP
jgi:hypothetical protein